MRVRRPTSRAALPVLIAIGMALVFVVVAVVVHRSAETERTSKGSDRPNIVVIMTDDQTLESMRVLEQTNRLLGDTGTTFQNYVVSFPVCCPSRATYLTGQYAKNHKVLDNRPPMGGFQKLDSSNTLPLWMQKAGYWTASVGKYLNHWGDDDQAKPPPGWNRWFGTMGETAYKYYDYDVSVDGRKKHYGSNQDDYQTDVLANEMDRIIRERANDDQPFYLSFTPLAPHAKGAEGRPDPNVLASAVPPLRYKNAFDTEALPKPPSYNEADISDKPGFGSRLEPISPASEARITENYRAELATLLALDDAVATIHKALVDTDQLQNTVIIFTSDNGFFHGEHRIPAGKFSLYENDIHVPLIITGGPFTAGEKVPAMTSNVDLSPTILELAEAAPGLPQDGRSLVGLVGHPEAGSDRGVLIENYASTKLQGEIRDQGVRTTRWVYIEHTNGSAELYDLLKDPYELENLADDPALADQRRILEDQLGKLRACHGPSCDKGS